MLVEHQKQWKFLKKSFELGRIPHAFLFYGQDRIGKKTTALEFIKLLNCQNKNPDSRPCQVCRSCQDIERRAHPDLMIIEPKGPAFAKATAGKKEIQIAQIREVQAHFALRPYSAPIKAAIIDEAHFLNREAQSALLKLLEEPKGQALFILITPFPEILLETILSRCERLRFYSAPGEFQKNGYQKKIITEISQISCQDLASRFQYVKKLAEEPQNLKEILDIWLRYFRELLLSAVEVRPRPFSGRDRVGPRYSLTKLKKILKLIQTTNFLISTTNVNPRLALEILMLEL